MKKRNLRIYEVATDTDVRASLQIAHVTITSSLGTHRADDEVCLVLKDLDGMELATMFTSQQLDNFILQLQQMKYALQERNGRRRGVKCPF